MADITLETIHTVLLGVPDTDDKGLLGEVKGINSRLDKMNDKVQRNTLFIARLKGALLILGVCGGSSGVVVGILNAIGAL